MSDKSPLSAWHVDEGPSPGFAERVVAAARETSLRDKAQRRRTLRVGLVAALAGAAAAVAVVVTPFGPRGGAAKGEAAAREQRMEVAMGTRATAVLETGAHVTWSGSDVVQTEGDVFYRVDKSGLAGLGQSPFVVHTPAGDVTVLGTCFRVKVSEMNRRDVTAGLVGATLGAVALVGVYEGHVAVSHAAQSVEVRAGQSAQLDAKGARATGDLAQGEKAFAAAAASGKDDPLLEANANLAGQVQRYKQQLADNDKAKRDLEARLKAAEGKLAAQNGGGSPLRSPYDLTQDDWKQMAKDGEFKARYPCNGGDGPFVASPDRLNDLGLPPEDGPALTSAFNASLQHLNSVVMAGCTQVVGAALANQLGPDNCEAVVRSTAKGSAAGDDMKKVAQILAGELPMPAANDPSVDPLERMLLAQSGELKQFENQLAQSIGPDEAHRVAYDDNLGACSSMMTSGPKPKLPPR
jgi:ferric-dicitrate binding protein FerR (iron transport regulator)